MSEQQLQAKLDDLMQAGDAEAEWQAALDFVTAARDAGQPPSLEFTADGGEAISQQAYLASAKARAVIRFGGSSYFWQPKDKKNTDAFFLE